jgi:hypothetical protein
MPVKAPLIELRHKPAPQPTLAFPEKGERDIVYISSHTALELDFIEGLLEIVFGRAVSRYPLSVRELTENLPDSNPCCVIVSQPVLHRHGHLEGIWKTVRKIFPATAVIWLVPDHSGPPSFLRAGDSAVNILCSQSSSQGTILRKFIKTIAEVTGILPSADLNLK